MELSIVIMLYILAFLIHDLEEILFVQRFGERNKENIVSRVPAFLKEKVSKALTITTAQFSVAVFLVFLFVLLGTYLGVTTLDSNHISLFFIANITVFFLHSFTHIGQSVLLKRYTPGVMTSVFVCIPFSLYVFHLLFQNNLITWKLIMLSIPLGLIILPVALIGQILGKKLIPDTRQFNQ